MLLKIYLVISIITLIIFILSTRSLENQASNKYGDKFKQLDKINKKDVAGKVFAWLQILIISFLPVVNIAFLFVIIFKYDEIRKNIFKQVEQEMREYGIE